MCVRCLACPLTPLCSLNHANTQQQHQGSDFSRQSTQSQHVASSGEAPQGGAQEVGSAAASASPQGPDNDAGLSTGVHGQPSEGAACAGTPHQGPDDSEGGTATGAELGAGGATAAEVVRRGGEQRTIMRLVMEMQKLEVRRAHLHAQYILGSQSRQHLTCALQS